MAKSKSAVDESVQAMEHLRGSDPLDAVYLFYGEDTYVEEQLIRAVEAKRFKGKPADPLSWEVYRAGDAETKKVIDSVRTVSMFGGPKVVIYRDVEKLNEADLDILVKYVQKPARSHLILVASKIDSRRKSWTEIKKGSHDVSCAPLSDRCVPEYVRSAASAKGLKLAPNTADAMANYIGPNRALIERALEKLTLALPENTVITPEIVEEHVVDTRERSIFELTKAITKRDIPGGLAALKVLLEQKQEPVAINGMLARHARMLLQTKIGIGQRMSEAAIAQQIGANPYAMREYMDAMPRYSLAELYRFHADVYETDKFLKSKPVPPELVLSKLLMSLMVPPSRP